jgi:hypothetical protein
VYGHLIYPMRTIWPAHFILHLCTLIIYGGGFCYETLQYTYTFQIQ